MGVFQDLQLSASVTIGMNGIHGIQKTVHMNSSGYQQGNGCPHESRNGRGQIQHIQGKMEPKAQDRPLSKPHQRKKAHDIAHALPGPLHVGHGYLGIHGNCYDTGIKSVHSP